RRVLVVPTRRAELVVVVRSVSVGPPIALHFSRLGVHHGYPTVDVPVGDVNLVGGSVDPQFRGFGEVDRIVAVRQIGGVAVGCFAVASDYRFARHWLTELGDELALLGELQEVGVAIPVRGDPDEALIVHVDAVVRLGPVVAGSWPTPGMY